MFLIKIEKLLWIWKGACVPFVPLWIRLWPQF